jgi:hypothetical protein
MAIGIKKHGSCLEASDSRFEHKYPVFTEKFYSRNHHENVCDKNVFLSFPWANYLDVLGDSSDPIGLKDAFDPELREAILAAVSPYGRVHTVCQHISWKSLVPLWNDLGVTHAGICHYEKDMEPEGINFTSWPLFACNYELTDKRKNLEIKETKDKRYLASFVGSYQKNHRTSIRLDLNNLKHERLYYELRDGWFFNGEVYSVFSDDQRDSNVIRYNYILSDSVFSLCPEGSGPNTIRLWESMAVGSIPVIYSDGWVPPQLPGLDWGDFSISIPCSGYVDTIEILSSVDAETVERMRFNCMNAYRQFAGMRCFGDPVRDFLESDLGHEETLEMYKRFCTYLMYQDPKVIRLVTSKLNSSAEDYARRSVAYKDHDGEKVYDRKNLADGWFIEDLPEERVVNHHTSGSTTGEPFRFRCDKKHWSFIQRNCEFDLIREEYGLLGKELRMLNLLKYPHNPKVEEFFLRLEDHQPGNMFNSFGSKKFVTHFVNWDGYMDDPDGWHGKLLDLLSSNFFDVVLSSGPVINILVRHIKKHGFTNRFAHLLSHTSEFPRTDDFLFLQSNGNIKCYCDHMRCWDGGASFFTCRFGTYHLNDNFAWVVEGSDNKMISTDYFNMAAPFINYWNGDLCEIGKEYQRCGCGRWYRPFKMLQNRPFALKGPTRLTKIKEQISRLDFKGKIGQVQFDGLSVNVHINERLDEESINKIKEILSEYTVRIHGG